MRIMSLIEILAELRFEARISSNVAHGSHLQDRHIALLRRVQEEVLLSYDWPMLGHFADAPVPAGQRYTAYPSTLEFDGVTNAYARLDGSVDDWRKLTYGVGIDQMNDADSDADDRRETTLRWANYLSPTADPVNTNMFEVWPIPESGITVRFDARRKLMPLVDINADHTTLDGPIIALHAAAELLAAQKSEDAGLKITKARERFDLLKRRHTGMDGRRVVMGGGGGATRPRGPNFSNL